jgi:molybdopterin converting factor small subunit
MQVTVKLFGTLRRFSNLETPGVWVGEISEGSTIGDLLGLLGTSERELAAASINNKNVEINAVIPGDAVVVLVTPVGGG